MSLASLPNAVELDLHEALLPSGLRLRIDRRDERRTGFAALGVDFGSIDRALDAAGTPVPAGAAHFLEHELFEDEQGDVSDRFSELGSSANAMTGFVGTTFVVSTAGDMLPSIELLLRFVQRPAFDDLRVARERSVIAQEIRMYDDDPDWRVFAALLECLYARHPVRDNIAGSEASIAAIDAAVLTHVHGRFYRPDNLCLAVSGPVDPERVLALALADQRDRPSGGEPLPSRGEEGEPAAIAAPRGELELPVERPRLLLGLKETELGGGPLAVSRRQLATRMLLDLLFGRSSEAYEALYGEGLIDETFSVGHSAEVGFGFTTVGGETDDPERLEQRLREVLFDAAARRLDPGAHGRIRNKLYGSLVRSLDQPENVAFSLVSSCFRGLPPFTALSLVDSIGLDELRQRADVHLREDALAVAVLRS